MESIASTTRHSEKVININPELPSPAAPASVITEAVAAALRTFFETGNPLALAEAYTAARLTELPSEAAPTVRNVWQAFRGRSTTPRPASQHVTAIVNGMTALARQLTALVKAQNRLAGKLITLHTTNQRFELEQQKHATAIAEQRALTAQAEAKTRALSEPTTHMVEATPSREQVTAVLNDMLPAILAGELAKSGAAATAAAEQRRAEELAEAQHETKLSAEALNRTLNEARVRGLNNPIAARRAKAERHAAREAREAEHRTQLYDQLARKMERQLRRLKKRHGEGSEAYEHAANEWAARLETLAQENGGAAS